MLSWLTCHYSYLRVELIAGRRYWRNGDRLLFGLLDRRPRHLNLDSNPRAGAMVAYESPDPMWLGI